jgi:serine/threonine-protein kinase
LGNFYDQVGRPRDAITQFSRAIELTTDNSGLYANLGIAYFNTDDPKMQIEAERAFKKSISINPTYGAYANLGNLYGMQHRFTESVAASAKALELNDQNYDVWSNLAQGYEWLGDEEKANAARKRTMELVERAIKLNPQDADAQATQAVLFAKAGFKSKALDKIQISLALSPNSQSVLVNVADTYELLGDRNLAIRYLDLAIQKGLPPQQLNADPYMRDLAANSKFRSHGN